MIRFWTMLALVLVFSAVVGAASTGGPQDKEIKLEGDFQDAEKDPVVGSPCRVHVVPLKKGRIYRIIMTGRGYFPYLRLENSAGRQLDDAHNDSLNPTAEIRFACTKDDEYRIICTFRANSEKAKGVRNYVLNIKRAGGEPTAAHAELYDKPAPELEGDFALNGKPVKLSDLKGKIVLLNFWAVQSSESAAMLPRLRELYRMHKQAGLEVVGVTYYNSELGHMLQFDEEAGKIRITNAAASPDTDQKMLAAFSAHHKLEHLLMVMHRRKALKMFEDYLVNGMPQVVLIDSDGVIRFVCTGDQRDRNDMEMQVMNLLAKDQSEPRR